MAVHIFCIFTWCSICPSHICYAAAATADETGRSFSCCNRPPEGLDDIDLCARTFCSLHLCGGAYFISKSLPFAKAMRAWHDSVSASVDHLYPQRYIPKRQTPICTLCPDLFFHLVIFLQFSEPPAHPGLSNWAPFHQAAFLRASLRQTSRLPLLLLPLQKVRRLARCWRIIHCMLDRPCHCTGWSCAPARGIARSFLGVLSLADVLLGDVFSHPVTAEGRQRSGWQRLRVLLVVRKSSKAALPVQRCSPRLFPIVLEFR